MEKKRVYTTHDWYLASYISREILNNRLATNLRGRFNEEKKKRPNKKRLEEFNANVEEILRVRNNYKNFQSVEKMEAIIEKYSEIKMKKAEDFY